MSSGQKVAISLLISVILFAAFAVAAFAGLFSVIEVRFYQPLVVKNIEQRIKTIAEKEQEYSSALDQRFLGFAAKKEIGSYASAKPSADMQKNRTTLTGTLFSQTPSLQGIRVIDKNGRNIHFSTYSSDEKNRSKNQVAYKNYADLGEIPFEAIACEDARNGNGSQHRIAWDGAKNRILYAYPFYDTYSAYRGTIIFYCDAGDFNRFLTAQNIIALSDTMVLVSNEIDRQTENAGGYAYGLPVVGADFLKSILMERIASKKAGSLEKIASTENGNWLAFIAFTPQGSFIARFTRDDILLFPLTIRILLLIIIFSTIFLVVFLIFNLKHDDMVVINDRIRHFQIAFIDEYESKKKNGAIKLLPGDIEQRKQVFFNEIKQSLGKRGKKYEAEVNALLDCSWNEIKASLRIPQTAAIASPAADTAELKRMLQEVLESGIQPAAKPQKPAATAVTPKAPPSPKPAIPLDEVEELDEVESLDEVDPLDEVESLDEVEPLEEVEPLDEVESLEEAEPLDEVESLEEAEPLDEVKSLDEVESVEETESLDEAEELGEAEPLDEAESVEEAESLDEAEPLDDEKPLASEIPAATTPQRPAANAGAPQAPLSPKPAAPLDEAEELDEVEPLEEAEPLDEAEPLAEYKPAYGAAQPRISVPMKNKNAMGETELTETARTTEHMQEPEDLPMLESSDSRATAFSFTNFGRNDTPATELVPAADERPEPKNAILEDADGVFHIANELPLESVKLDMNFKQLVDSILE